MKRFILLFLLSSLYSQAQNLTLVKATKQVLNHGASPASSTNYKILLCNCSKAKWSIDSVISISSGQRIKFKLFKIEGVNETVQLPINVDAPFNPGTGNFRLTFESIKYREGGRPGSPQPTETDTTAIEGGVIIYYSIKKKQRTMKIDSFEELEKINTP